MARYKGQRKVSKNERDFPHHVEMPLPPCGFGRRLDEMNDWHLEQGIQSVRGRGHYESDRHYIKWCFADRETAEAFKRAFGGYEPMPKNDPKALIDWAKRNIQDS